MKNETDVLRILTTSTRRIEHVLRGLDKRSRLLGWLRLLVFLGGLGLFIYLGEMRYWTGTLASATFSVSLFVYLVKKHQGLKVQQRRCRHSLKLRQNARARLALDWPQIPELPLEEPLKGHPFEIDLDITGPISLYRLLHLCLSAEGSERLKSWLLQRSPKLSDIQRRQKQVADLRTRRSFRESLELSLYEADARFRQQHQSHDKGFWQSGEIRSVLEQLPVRVIGTTLLILAALAGLTAVFFVLDSSALWSNAFWKVSVSLYVLFFWLRRDLVGNLFKEAQGVQYSLSQLTAVFGVLEKLGPVQAESIQQLLEPLLSPEYRPSVVMRQLGRIVGGAGLQGNPLIWVMANIVMPWDFYFAWRLEQVKPLLKQNLPQWLDCLWELEALNSLAEFAWLHPEACFPDLTAELTDQGFITENLGHPLLPPDQKVRNSFRLKGCGEAFLITGSNMSGKSTFLKSLGVNLVLAQAGAVVDATAFVAAPMRLFTCIKVSDSVTDGLSYFYAEVKRLRALLEAIDLVTPTESNKPLPPVFFLVDEIFKGTNNRERLIGSRSYLQALTDKRALGGVSTHDLELVQVAAENTALSNYHFREHIIDQKMVFDYTLRSGPCPTTNALRIMAMEGLPIELGE